MEVRDLLPSHAFREFVKVWGEPSVRKRIIVAPKMTETVKDAPACFDRKLLTTYPRVKELFSGARTLFNVDAEIEKRKITNSEIKCWINERRMLHRGIENMSIDVEAQMGLLGFSSCGDDASNNLPTLFPAFSQPACPVVTHAHVDMLPILSRPFPVALALIAEYIQAKRVRLVDLFAHMDKDKNWLATRAEIRNALMQTGLPLKEDDLNELIVLLDVNNDDQLSYKELARGIEAYTKDKRWQKLKMMYDKVVEEEYGSRCEAWRGSASHQTCGDSRVHSMEIRNSLDNTIFSGSSSSSPTHATSPRLIHTDGVEKSPNLPQLEVVWNKYPQPNRSQNSRLAKLQSRRDRKLKDGAPEQESSELNQTTITGDFKELKNRYIAYINKECESCIRRLQDEGIFINGDSVRRVLVPPLDASTGICTSTLSHERSVFPVSHPANANARKRQKIRLKNMGRVSDSRSPLIFTNIPRDNPFGLPRVARIDFKGRAKEGRRRRDEIAGAPPSVCWPQHLLDKVRVCLDTQNQPLGSETLFSVVR